MSMSNREFMTRIDFAYEHKIPYSIVTDRIRRREIALHFVDNKVQINVDEALKACVRRRSGPVAKAISEDLFA
jgi:hypothetical protein